MLEYRKFDINSPIKELNEYTSMCLDLMDIHLKSAQALGLYDEICSSYTVNEALCDLGADYDYFYFIMLNDEIIGYIILSNNPKCEKEIYYNKGEKYIELINLYIKQKYRRKGYGKQVIYDILNHVDRLDVDCYYTLDSHKFYQSLGFTPFYTSYVKKGSGKEVYN